MGKEETLSVKPVKSPRAVRTAQLEDGAARAVRAMFDDIGTTHTGPPTPLPSDGVEEEASARLAPPTPSLAGPIGYQTSLTTSPLQTAVAATQPRRHGGLTIYPSASLRSALHALSERFELAESIIVEFALEHLLARESPESIAAVLKSRGHGKRRARLS